MFAALAVALAALPSAVAAQSVVDTDLDGIADMGDVFPCDWRRTAVTFVPGEQDFATLMFEDNWPARGDLDFNDAVLLHNVAVFHDASGRATGLRLTLVPRAIGANIASGVALRLPIPARSVGNIVRTVGAGSPTALTVLADETDLVVPIVTHLRDLFDGAVGFLNTDRALPVRGDGDGVTVELTFAQPVALSLAGDPFDVYFFRTDDPRHQIHRPQFSGTDTMRDALFGTADDGSSGARAFVDTDGMPFVLSIPEQSIWPMERERVERLWPDLTTFAESGGTQAQDFYATNVDLSKAFPAPAGAAVPGLDYAACVAPSCTDGARNGVETDVDCGGACGPCGVGGACRAHDDCGTGVCVAAACIEGDVRSCALANGTGTQARAGEGWAPCVATACDAGYRLSGGACVLVTYAWSAGAWGACGGGTTTPSYGAWGACSGGSGTWSSSAWGACSATAVCGGAGTQTRSTTCDVTASSGTQARSASCAWDPNSGSQSRAVTCVNNFGEAVASSSCASAPPAASQSCTPGAAPSCGALVTSQACTPSGTFACGAQPATSQACASPAGSQSCAIANGVGTQSCAAGSSTWGACTVTSCNAGYTLSNGACVANPAVASTSLLVHLDAANASSYPGTGTTWFDLSGQNNHFTLFNGVTWNASGFMRLDGVNDFIRSNANLNLAAYDQVLVEIWVRSSVLTNFMAFEHTANWNTIAGGFGLAMHSGGFGTVVNQHHTNHSMSTVVRNYDAAVGTGWSQQVNTFSRVADASGRLAYVNGARVPFVAVNGWSTSTSGPASFTNALFFVGSRAGTGSFLDGDVAILRIYGVRLSDAAVSQNFGANRARFGL